MLKTNTIATDIVVKAPSIYLDGFFLQRCDLVNMRLLAKINLFLVIFLKEKMYPHQGTFQQHVLLEHQLTS